MISKVESSDARGFANLNPRAWLDFYKGCQI